MMIDISESSIWMNQQQQLARQYLATLVKLSDNLVADNASINICTYFELKF